MASLEEVLWEFESQRQFQNRRTPGGQVHIYQLGHEKTPMCARTITGKTWETDEDVTCEKCKEEWEAAARIYVANRIQRWWVNPPSYTGRRLETTPKPKSKSVQGGFDLDVEEPLTYGKKGKEHYE